MNGYSSGSTTLPAGTYRCCALLSTGGVFAPPNTAVIDDVDGNFGWNAGTINVADYDYKNHVEFRVYEFTLSEPMRMHCVAEASSNVTMYASAIAVYKIS